MPEYEFIGKSKLARGFSYPLKRSALDSFLDGNNISLVTGVAYCEPSDEQRVLSATYYGPKNQEHRATLTIWVNAVPSRFRKHVSDQLEDAFLPRIGNWIVSLTDSTLLANQMDRRLEIFYNENTDDESCVLDLRIDEKRDPIRLSRFRAKVRP